MSWQNKCPAVVRRRRIVQLLRRSGHVEVAELTRMLGVSAMTIRRDLGDLEREGLGVRVWGGLVTPGRAAPEGRPASLHEAEEMLDRAQHHLLRVERALHQGYVAEAHDHVRAILRYLGRENTAQAISRGTQRDASDSRSSRRARI